MELNTKIAEYGNFPNIHRYNDILGIIESQFNEIGCLDYSVKLEQIQKSQSAYNRMTQLDANQSLNPDNWMLVEGRHHTYPFQLYIPFKGKKPLPYLLQLEMDVQFGDIATYKRAFLGAKWHLESGDKERAAQLSRLKLPSVNWSQAKGESALHIYSGFSIEAHPEKKKKTVWYIHSFFQGFLVGIGPKIVQYFNALPKLEAFLKNWMYEGSSLKL